MLETIELDVVLQEGFQKSGAEGQNHLPWTAGHAAFDGAHAQETHA